MAMLDYRAKHAIAFVLGRFTRQERQLLADSFPLPAEIATLDLKAISQQKSSRIPLFRAILTFIRSGEAAACQREMRVRAKELLQAQAAAKIQSLVDYHLWEQGIYPNTPTRRRAAAVDIESWREQQ